MENDSQSAARAGADAVIGALRSAGAEARGAAVVMDVRNGDVLAMVSHPAFDPNLFVPRITDADWQRLNDPVLLPMINHATYGAYAPGSIFKIVVGLAGLEAGVIHPEETYSSPGYYQLGRTGHGRRIRDLALGGQPAEFDFKRALKLSSNAYFIHHGLFVGSEKILALGQRLHLGEKTGLPTGQAVAGVFPTAEGRWPTSGDGTMATPPISASGLGNNFIHTSCQTRRQAGGSRLGSM